MLVRTSLILMYRKSFRQSLWHSEADAAAGQPPPKRNPNYYPSYAVGDEYIAAKSMPRKRKPVIPMVSRPD